ncbi:hypothetical protein D9X30_1785 [Cupriavidus sp. U2]|nr:hypothetical protein D9X30_1785 [Cupriavidus sp. U2]
MPSRRQGFRDDAKKACHGPPAAPPSIQNNLHCHLAGKTVRRISEALFFRMKTMGYVDCRCMNKGQIA